MSAEAGVVGDGVGAAPNAGGAIGAVGPARGGAA